MEGENKYAKFFIEQFDFITNAVREINKNYGGALGENIKQKREFFQHLTVLSGAVIGFSSIFGYERILNLLYFQIGFFLNLLFIVIIALYFREVLDKEGNELLAKHDTYNTILERKLDIINKYLKNGIFTEQAAFKYLEEVELLQETQDLKEEDVKSKKERKDRLEKKNNLDFSGEIFIFLFALASLFIFISFFFEKIKIYILLFVIIFIIIMVFTDSINFFTNKISKFLNIFRR